MKPSVCLLLLLWRFLSASHLSSAPFPQRLRSPEPWERRKGLPFFCPPATSPYGPALFLDYYEVRRGWGCVCAASLTSFTSGLGALALMFHRWRLEGPGNVFFTLSSCRHKATRRHCHRWLCSWSFACERWMLVMDSAVTCGHYVCGGGGGGRGSDWGGREGSGDGRGGEEWGVWRISCICEAALVKPSVSKHEDQLVLFLHQVIVKQHKGRWEKRSRMFGNSGGRGKSKVNQLAGDGKVLLLVPHIVKAKKN